MEPINEYFSIIILGAWNPQILLNQQWIAQHLLENKQEQITFAVPVNNSALPPRISFGDILIFPEMAKLTIQTSVPSLQGLQKSAKTAQKIMGLLEHTPIYSLGVNVGFLSNDTIESVADMVFSDTDRLEKITSGVVGIEILRSIPLDATRMLNFKLAKNGGQTIFDFNFNHQSVERDRYINYLEDEAVKYDYDLAIQILKDVYECEIQ